MYILLIKMLLGLYLFIDVYYFLNVINRSCKFFIKDVCKKYDLGNLKDFIYFLYLC